MLSRMRSTKRKTWEKWQREGKRGRGRGEQQSEEVVVTRGWGGEATESVCFEALSLFLPASNTCPVEGVLPRRREAAGRGRASVLHEKQPICKMKLAGYW